MIDPNLQIMEVRRIYASHTEDDDYMDFDAGSLFMSVDGKCPADDYGVGYEGNVFSSCDIVLRSESVLAKLEKMSWSDEGNYWVAEKDCYPLSDETDARIRAMIALNGETPMIVKDLNKLLRENDHAEVSSQS